MLETRKRFQFVASFSMWIYWSATTHSNWLKLVLWKYHTNYIKMVEDLETSKFSSFLCNGSQLWPDYERIKIFSKNKNPNSSLRKVFILEIKAFVRLTSWSEGKGEFFFHHTSFYTVRKEVWGNCIKPTKTIFKSLLKSEVALEGNLKALTSHLLIRKQHV